nr:hypothetical protein [Nanoarchaeum sp.]
MALNRLAKTALIISIPLALAWGVYNYGAFWHPDVYRTGTVVKEKYIPRQLQEKTHVGVFSSYDYVGLGESQYILTVESEGQQWVLDVQDGSNGSKESLDEVVQEGTVISFKEGYKKCSRKGSDFFYSDFRNQRGRIYTDYIKVPL